MTTVEISKRQYYQIGEMTEWLKNNVGYGGWRPMLDSRWHIESAFGNTNIIFKDSADATLFALRWL